MKHILSSLALGAGILATASLSPTAALLAQDHDDLIGAVPSATGLAAEVAQKDAPYFVITRPIPNSDQTFDLHFVQSRDQIYLPLGVRKPDGEGPFPAILMGRGNGVHGVAKVEEQLYMMEPMIDRMVARGYVVAFANYRNEIPFAYNQIDRSENSFDDMSGGDRTLKSTASLDSDDFISLVQHLQALPFVDEKSVGTIGVSHSGELMHKAASRIDFGAAIPIEPAAHEFLAVDTTKAPRKGRTMMLDNVEIVKSLADKDRAMERINRINTPFLYLGRDRDHLQGLFRLAYEWMAEAGKDATWMSFDHPVHGYAFHYRKEDGSYAPDAMQQEVFEIWMAFFDKHLKHAETASADIDK